MNMPEQPELFAVETKLSPRARWKDEHEIVIERCRGGWLAYSPKDLNGTFHEAQDIDELISETEDEAIAALMQRCNGRIPPFNPDLYR